MDLTECPHEACDVVAEITRRVVLESTHGPVEHVHTQCLRGHWFYLPVQWLEIRSRRASI
jgi:hypothetical protein